MQKTLSSNNHPVVSAQPRLHQTAPEIQAYGTVSHLLPLELEEPVRLEMTERLNQLLADTITLRDLYKKSHWQVVGPTFYQLHLLFEQLLDRPADPGALAYFAGELDDGITDELVITQLISSDEYYDNVQV